MAWAGLVLSRRQDLASETSSANSEVVVGDGFDDKFAYTLGDNLHDLPIWLDQTMSVCEQRALHDLHVPSASSSCCRWLIHARLSTATFATWIYQS